MQRRTFREALTWASSLLQSRRFALPPTVAESGEGTGGQLNLSPLNPKIADWLLAHLVGGDRATWLQRLDEAMPCECWEVYQKWIYRVIDGEPYQYIIGTEDFYGRTFSVNANVLIPRPETELLVEQVLIQGKAYIQTSPSCRIVDVGTGSGAIAVTLALEWPEADVWATDISAEAIAVARQNAEAWKASVHFLQGNLLEPLMQPEAQHKVDILVSNPPYIPTEQRSILARNVLDFEPHTALFAPENGTHFYRQILSQAQSILAEQALIAFEVGMGQAEQVRALILQHFPQAECQVSKDYQGIDRIVTAKIGHHHGRAISNKGERL